MLSVDIGARALYLSRVLKRAIVRRKSSVCGGAGSVEVREIHYMQNVFRFERFPGDLFEGRLLLDGVQREMLLGLVRAEDESWYLDEHGERLPGEQLFALSPWSCPGPHGPTKLLCRILDLRDGRVLFSTPDSYLEGGLFDWMRNRNRRGLSEPSATADGPDKSS